MTTTTRKTWAYKVVKTQRGNQGQWFRYPAAATFATQSEAEQYAEQFAADQRGVAGTRILVVARKGGDVVKAFAVEA
jgi:hypothetical protein